MILDESETRVRVSKSALPGAGDGLFAAKALPRGALNEVVGTLVQPGSAADRCTAYADAYKFRVGRRLLIPTGYGALANHSPAPNMEKLVRGSRVFLRALRRVEKGTELVFTYSRYARKRFKLA